MKKHLILFILFALAAPAIAAGQETSPRKAAAPPSGKAEIFLQEGSVIGFHFLKYKEPCDKAENERFLKQEYFPNWRNLMPGSRVYFLRGERGAREGRDVFCWVFKNEEARDVYFPEKNVSTPVYAERRKTINWLYTENTFYKYNEGWEWDLSADYVVIAAGKKVKKDWMAPGAVIGMHHLILKAGTDPAEFEQYIRSTWAPARADATPGSKVFFLRGIRGHNENAFAMMWVIPSKARRDAYFPAPDRASKLYEKRRARWSWIYDDAHLGKYIDSWDAGRQADFIVVQ